MTFTPTDEQVECLDLFRSGAGMAIEAGAGTGKTSTLRLLASSTNRHGRYLAFNKAIVQDVRGSMGDHVQASTAHSVAFRAVGTRYAHRLGAKRMRSMELARRLGIDPIYLNLGMERKVLQPGYLASLTMRSIVRFCQTADTEPEGRHVPYIEGIDLPTSDGKRGWVNNDEVRRALVAPMRRAWADIRDTDGQLPFRHDHYLKLWQLSHPRIDADFILFDEAQDANPVMAAVVAEQNHAQVVYVGDSNQAIYEFTGAVNTLARLDVSHRRFLTQSFRFGPAIAELANEVLVRLGSELTLRGHPPIESIVEPCAFPDAILCRTNAEAMQQVLNAQEDGISAALVGGGAEVAAFARAVDELRASGWTSHPELACFTTWGEVQHYVENDPQGGELALMVRLVEEFGTDVILTALDTMPTEARAQLTVSTAHKSKGREWGRVKLAGDFLDVAEEDPELRLRYVAITRARLHLDHTAIIRKDEPEDEQ